MKGVLDGYDYSPSPNIHKDRSMTPIATVIHYTGGFSMRGTVKWMMDERSKVSAHFVIGRSGDVMQLVPLHVPAWHAGTSELVIEGESRSGCNAFTIGIEVCNLGLLIEHEGKLHYKIGKQMREYKATAAVKSRLYYDNDTLVEGHWEPYYENQVIALQKLLQDLRAEGYSVAVNRLIGHESIAMPFGRKRDPGPLFPWERFGNPPQRTLRS